MNFSAVQLARAGWRQAFIDTLARHGVDPGRMIDHFRRGVRDACQVGVDRMQVRGDVDLEGGLWFWRGECHFGLAFVLERDIFVFGRGATIFYGGSAALSAAFRLGA